MAVLDWPDAVGASLVILCPGSGVEELVSPLLELTTILLFVLLLPSERRPEAERILARAEFG